MNTGERLRSETWLLSVGGACLACLIILNNVIYHYQPSNDALIYLALGREFARFEFVNPATTWSLAPGYSLFLAILSPLTGWKPQFIAMWQAVLFYVAALAYVRELRRGHVLRDPLEFRLAFLLLVGNPNLWFPMGAIGSEFLAGVLVLLVTTALLRARRIQTNGALLVASGWLGCLAITRFEWLALPFLAVFLLPKSKRGRAALLLVIGPMLALALNGFRNQITFGEFRPMSYGGGAAIYGGNNLNLDGSWHKGEDWDIYVPEAHHTAFHKLQDLKTENFNQFVREQDAFWRELAREAWASGPVIQLGVIPLKFGKLWAMPNHFDIYTGDRTYVRSLQIAELLNVNRWPWYGPWKHGLYLFLHWVLLGLVGVGFIRSWRERTNHDARAFCLYVFAVFAAMSLIFAVPLYGLSRFHVPILMLLSSFAVNPLASLIRSRVPALAVINPRPE